MWMLGYLVSSEKLSLRRRCVFSPELQVPGSHAEIWVGWEVRGGEKNREDCSKEKEDHVQRL